jgi:exodeoxyribonuclease VII large subunit
MVGPVPSSLRNVREEAPQVPGGVDAISIAELYGQVKSVLSRAFPRDRPVWVRGEIQSISDHHTRTGHCYIDLVDPDSAGERQAPTLRVKCWRRTWGPMRAALASEGITLEAGMVVVLRGEIDFYPARAEVNFVLAEIDVTALLGRLAAQRAALLRTLAAEGLLERNRSLPVPAVPLRIGLVASPGTEGFRDFMGQLEASGFAFHVLVSPATVQGAGAPRSIAVALATAGAAGCDLVVMVRGGGAKADLAAFDSELVARAVATSPVPVWTGIGHTGDESVADLVGNRAFVTPTGCGAELAQRVRAWWEGAVSAADLVTRRAEEVLTDAERRDAAARVRLTGAARHQLRAHGERLSARTAVLAKGVPQRVDVAHADLTSRAARLAPMARDHLVRSGERLNGWRRLLAAYDVERQLERGYTLTLDGAGRPIRSVADLVPGDEMTTRFADGVARSRVEATEHSVTTPPEGEAMEGSNDDHDG